MTEFMLSLLNLCIRPFQIIDNAIIIIPMMFILVWFVFATFNRLMYGERKEK